MARRGNLTKKLAEEGSVRPLDESSKAPNYLPWKPKFYCPLSPSLLWFHGLQYTSCPLSPEHRDMDECSSCPCRAGNTDELIAQREKREKEYRRKRKGSDGDAKRGRKQAPRRPPVVVREKGKPYVTP